MRFRYDAGPGRRPLGPALDATVLSDEHAEEMEGERIRALGFTGAFVGLWAWDLTGAGCRAISTRRRTALRACRSDQDRAAGWRVGVRFRVTPQPVVGPGGSACPSIAVDRGVAARTVRRRSPPCTSCSWPAPSTASPSASTSNCATTGTRSRWNSRCPSARWPRPSDGTRRTSCSRPC
ncbi:hypothetical protein ACFZDP_29515 [Streptomyces mirabilis]|uniref:beta-xylosidase family glycoside hydrolase n=1 Tax=Streptomyces mirabilis TaxID=68239 RepID=UPI0036E914D5